MRKLGNANGVDQIDLLILHGRRMFRSWVSLGGSNSEADGFGRP
jgi:hypothetical protein